MPQKIWKWRIVNSSIITIIKTTSEVDDGDGDGTCNWLASDGGRGQSGHG